MILGHLLKTIRYHYDPILWSSPWIQQPNGEVDSGPEDHPEVYGCHESTFLVYLTYVGCIRPYHSALICPRYVPLLVPVQIYTPRIPLARGEVGVLSDQQFVWHGCQHTHSGLVRGFGWPPTTCLYVWNPISCCSCCKITKRLNHVTNHLFLHGSLKINPTFNFSLLKQFLSCSLSPIGTPLPPPQIAGGQPAYMVYRILDS